MPFSQKFTDVQGLDETTQCDEFPCVYSNGPRDEMANNSLQHGGHGADNELVEQNRHSGMQTSRHVRNEHMR